MNFFCWAFWGFALPGHGADSAPRGGGHLSADDRADLEEMADLFEEHTCHRFPRAAALADGRTETGRTEALPLMSFTLERVDGSYFPLALYAATRALNAGYGLLLVARGFRRARAVPTHLHLRAPARGRASHS